MSDLGKNFLESIPVDFLSAVIGREVEEFPGLLDSIPDNVAFGTTECLRRCGLNSTRPITSQLESSNRDNPWDEKTNAIPQRLNRLVTAPVVDKGPGEARLLVAQSALEGTSQSSENDSSIITALVCSSHDDLVQQANVLNSIWLSVYKQLSSSSSSLALPSSASFAVGLKHSSAERRLPLFGHVLSVKRRVPALSELPVTTATTRIHGIATRLLLVLYVPNLVGDQVDGARGNKAVMDMGFAMHVIRIWCEV